MGIMQLIANKKRKLRESQDKLLYGGSDEKLKHLKAEKEYYNKIAEEDKLKSDVKTMKRAKFEKRIEPIKKGVSELKKSVKNRKNSEEYKNNPWRNP